MGRQYTLLRQQHVSASLPAVTEFFEDPRNLEALTPSFLNFQIETPGAIEMRMGALIDYKIGLYGVPMRWRTRIERYNPGVDFVDLQLKGPYKYWHHLHTFRATARGTEIGDRVTYELPFGLFGTLAHFLFVRRQLKTIFDHRTRVVEDLFGTA
jgi:ligand-binding SRPBCC domain-containing protein